MHLILKLGRWKIEKKKVLYEVRFVDVDCRYERSVFQKSHSFYFGIKFSFQMNLNLQNCLYKKYDYFQYNKYGSFTDYYYYSKYYFDFHLSLMPTIVSCCLQ